MRRVDAPAVARPALQPGEKFLDRLQYVMRGRLADRLAGPLRLGTEQRALEAQPLILVEGREVLKPGVGFESIDRVPRLFHRRCGALPRFLQVDQIITLGAVVLRVVMQRAHSSKSQFRLASARSIKCSPASC